MGEVSTIGLDIAKSVFQVHGVDAAGQVVIRRQLKRRYVLAFFERLPPCLVGIEACASSHHWSRELKVLGHTVKLMPPAYVKPYVKRQKNDATDAEAICDNRWPAKQLRITFPDGRPSPPDTTNRIVHARSLPIGPVGSECVQVGGVERPVKIDQCIKRASIACRRFFSRYFRGKGHRILRRI